AIGVIVCNNNPGERVFTMGGDPQQAIPAVMVSYEDCQILKAEIANGLTVTIKISAVKVQDSDLDNGIIAHEYGHGISNRLTGGASMPNCLTNQEQMGEGWSDFFALLLQMKPGDLETDANGIGTYASWQNATGGGIRPFPYTTDMGVNPFTYNDIDGVSIPHGVGSVWCTMLWDMTWNLIERHGFQPDVYNITGGNGIAMQLVMEGMKLQPCSPGFVDGRDAILAADTLLFGGANSCEIWRAFARRGLGVDALQGSTNDVTDGTESYVTPVSCQCTDQNVTYSGVSIPNGTEDRANTTISIDNSTIQSGDNVSLTAGQEISVQPTFELVNPATLLLDIRPCDDSVLPGSIMPDQEKMVRILKSNTSTNFIRSK
ncbi:MAG: M36 family metallopeptidase, partial [Saprospiraceae bacterium]|nr:M36 family metallopeptidase [Saprospiraceae bacterium]